MGNERKCYSCGEPGGKGKRELRPYGPNGADVCAGCVFGEKGGKPDPTKLAEAEKQLGKQMLAPGPLVLDNREQVGPRPVRSRGRS